MVKLPFTARGIAKLGKQLFRMHEHQLKTEVAMVKDDLKSWLGTHFLLEDSVYLRLLGLMKPDAYAHLAERISFFMGNRKRIKVIFENRIVGSPISIDLKEEAELSFNSKGELYIFGPLVITISDSND